VAGRAAWSALAQDKPADTMQILKEKVKADKKLVVGRRLIVSRSF
jgi:hypothetical protein